MVQRHGLVVEQVKAVERNFHEVARVFHLVVFHGGIGRVRQVRQPEKIELVLSHMRLLRLV